MLIFFESALHASLPWFGPPGTERRSLLFRVAPRHSSHRSGRGTHWGGTWTYEARQPSWVDDELTAEQRETLSAARGSLASTFHLSARGTKLLVARCRLSTRTISLMVGRHTLIHYLTTSLGDTATDHAADRWAANLHAVGRAITSR